MQIICTSLQTMPIPHHSVFTSWMPFLPLNQQRQSTKGTEQLIFYYYYYIRSKAFFQDNLDKPAPEKQSHSGKTNLDLLEQEIVSDSGINELSHMQICTLPQTDNHVSTPPLSFYRPDALPATQPTASKH